MSADVRPELAGVAVVVVNYGSSALIEENVVGTGLHRSGVTVVVVDNASTTAERGRMRALAAAHGFVLVEMDRNVGFGAGMNAGVARSAALGHDTFLLLNPDASIPTDGLAALVDDVRRHPMTLLSPVIVRPDGRPWFTGACVDVEDGRTRRSAGVGPDVRHPWLAGTCLVVHRTLWEAIDGFDDRYFLYWEDVDLSWRCRQAGGRVAVRDDVRAVHSVGGTQGTSGKSPTYYYWNCRNRLLFATQHLSRGDVARWALTTPRYAKAVLLRGGRRQLLHPVAPLSAILRGSCAGLLLALRAWVRPSRRPIPHAPGATP